MNGRLQDVWLAYILPACTPLSQNALYFTCHLLRDAVSDLTRGRLRKWIVGKVMNADLRMLKLSAVDTIAAPVLLQRLKSFLPQASDVGVMLLAELTCETAHFYGRDYLTSAFAKANQQPLVDGVLARFHPCRHEEDVALLRLFICWHLIPNEYLIWLRIRPPLPGDILELDVADELCHGGTYIALANGVSDLVDFRTTAVFSRTRAVWYRALISSMVSDSIAAVRAVVDALRSRNDTPNPSHFMTPHILALASIHPNDAVLVTVSELLTLDVLIRDETIALVAQFYPERSDVAAIRFNAIFPMMKTPQHPNTAQL